jgi:hypothetical protein
LQGIKLHDDLPENSYDYPYTVATVIRLRGNIDSFMELPKDKRPPEDIWFDSIELEEWFDRIYDSGKQTELELVIEDVEG